MTGFFTAGFLVADFFATAAGFLAGDSVDFLDGAAFVVVFFVVESFTPASLASFDTADLRRATVFFFMRFFLKALSYSECTALRDSAEGFALKALSDDLISRLMPTFRSRRTVACLTLLMADLMIGTRGSFIGLI